jgi:outer membrane protein with beta-barrel domain
MKRILVVSLVVFGVVAFAATAGAENLLGTLELNGGYAKSSTEVGPSTDTMGGGLGVNAAYWRSISPQFSWGAQIGYDGLGSVTQTVTDPITLLSEDVKTSGSVFRINPAIRYNFSAGVGPNFYAQAGAGLYSVTAKAEIAGVSASNSESKMGFNFGAGVGFPIGPKTRLNFQGAYHTVSTEGSSTNYITFTGGVGFGL